MRARRVRGGLPPVPPVQRVTAAPDRGDDSSQGSPAGRQLPERLFDQLLDDVQADRLGHSCSGSMPAPPSAWARTNQADERHAGGDRIAMVGESGSTAGPTA